MGTISRQTTWSTGDTLTASDINGEFDNILSTANGSLNADNLGVTAGQAAASKAIVLDSNKDFADTSSSNQIRNLTISGSLKIGTTFLPDASGGADLGSTALEWGDVYIADDKKIYLGSDQDISLQYDETTNNALEIAAAVEGAALGIVLKSDQGDDAGDEWKLNIADGGTLTLGNDIASAGTYVTHLTLTPNSTVSSSTLALAGGLTVAGTASITGVATVGGITIGSAVINEAELETIDGITAGTVAASKAVVVDSNKDIGTFRNVTIDGTFSDGNYTFDTSGNVSGLGTIGSGAITSTGVVTATGFTIGSAVINEAELETIDGVTAGTVAASKAVVVDSNKDIGSFRNVTLTGELDAATLDISGNADIDGTTNLDAVDIDGAVQVDATITVGADDQGYDIIFYGDTASANMTWDTSADDLILNGGAGLIVPDGQLTLGSTALAATAAELNVLDGVTAGTVAASKGVVVDANKDIGSFRNVTLTGELDAATLDISGNADIDGTTNLDAVDIDGAVQIDAAVTVGVDDTGYDVKFFGATSGSSMLWDESADDLILTNAGLAVGSDATGDLYYRNSSGYLARLGVGSDGQVLTSTGTLPNWESAAGGGHTIQEEGSSLTQRTNLNFVGAGVTATDDSGNNATKVTVTPTGASLPVTRSDGSTSDPIALTSAALGESLVSDTSPQLGGNLDVNGQSIVSASNGNIQITPNGTGSVLVGVDDTGPAVKFFGAPSNRYMLWDESGDLLNLRSDLSVFRGSNGTDRRFFVDESSGGVSFNTDSGSVAPDGHVHIHSGSAGSVSASVHYDDLVVEGSGNTGISILAPEDYTSGIAFGSNNDNDIGYIYAQQSGTATSRFMAFAVNAAERLRIKSDGDIQVGANGDLRIGNGVLDVDATETYGNSFMSQGVTLNQGGSDNEIMAFKANEVSHNMTSLAEADTYGVIQKQSGTAGGASLRGFADTADNPAVTLISYMTGISSTKSTSGNGAIGLQASLTNGSGGAGSCASDDNLVCIHNHGTTRFIFDAEGSAHADVEWTTFDTHDDITMLHDIEATLVPDTFGKSMKYDQEYLMKIGILGTDSLHEEIPGRTRGMINTTKLQMLHHGAIRQVHQQLQDVKEFYEDKIAALEQRLLRLEA